MSDSDFDPAQSADDAARPHCWECRRRRLVCDGKQPICNRCWTARIVCPGYADKKPLTWLAPGQVVSRARKRKGRRKPESYTSRPENEKPSEVTTEMAKYPAPSDDSGSGNSHVPDELDLPAPVELRAEVLDDVYEALQYYNGRIYPDLINHQLGPNGFQTPTVLVANVPPAIVHTLVSVAIGHRIISMVEEPSSNELVKPIWSRLYRHRDIAIRCLHKLVGNENTRGGIVSLISVYTFLIAVLQQSMSPNWRAHIDGFLTLIRPRGSFRDIIRVVPGMDLCLMALLMIGTLANTTSPAANLLTLTTTQDALTLVRDLYTESYYPAVSLPPPLLTEIILVNALRAEAYSISSSSSTIHETALAILARINSFSPASWAASRPAFHSDWALIAPAFHAATALYAILSLQSCGALPRSSGPELDLARAKHARMLFSILEDAMAAPRVRRRMLWPLIVAGVDVVCVSTSTAGRTGAGRGGAGGGSGSGRREGRLGDGTEAAWGVKRWIAETLGQMSREMGTATPVVARRALERFWARGGGTWDECFEVPMAVVI